MQLENEFHSQPAATSESKQVVLKWPVTELPVNQRLLFCHANFVTVHKNKCEKVVQLAGSS